MNVSQPRNEPPTILIVEDERGLADLFAAWLNELYTIEAVDSGEKALKRLGEHVNVVLLDRRMPNVAGDEILTHIRSEGYDIRVVIVSAVTPDFDVIEMGFDEYPVTPAESEELCATVERMLARANDDETMKEDTQLAAAKGLVQEQKKSVAVQKYDPYRDFGSGGDTGNR